MNDVSKHKNAFTIIFEISWEQLRIYYNLKYLASATKQFDSNNLSTENQSEILLLVKTHIKDYTEFLKRFSAILN